MRKTVFKHALNGMHPVEKIYRLFIARHLLVPLSKTKIVPNAITILNFCLVPFCVYFAFVKNIPLTLLFFSAYCFVDHVDGMLARYKNQLSRFGYALDIISDNACFYLTTAAIGWGIVSIWWLLFSSLSMLLYDVVSSKYIAPKVRKIKLTREYKRSKLKDFFVRRYAVLIGMNFLSNQMLMLLLLPFGLFRVYYLLLSFLYLLDLLWRLKELKANS